MAEAQRSEKKNHQKIVFEYKLITEDYAPQGEMERTKSYYSEH